MKVSIPPGKYVLAVSGGIDSMVLLDLAAKLDSLELIVAHLNHGIREDSIEDEQLVKRASKLYGLKFESKQAKLDSNSSEDLARQVRYQFLNDVKLKYGAVAIITAHHKDDALETAVLNLMRGTGRKGLSSLSSSKEILRPLIGFSKQDIAEYALANGIKWREDSTNSDDRYLRNYIRHNIIPKLSEQQRSALSNNIVNSGQVNKEIDDLLSSIISMHQSNGKLERSWFIQLPYDVSSEVMAEWLRNNGIREFNRKLINNLVVFGKTAMIGKKADIDAGHWLLANKRELVISDRRP